LAGVASAEQRGEGFVIKCTDANSSDSALRALLTQYPQARDIEVRGAGLEEAFLDLTGDEPEGERA
jgi:ABC-2 type transport system ATP-binding protein